MEDKQTSGISENKGSLAALSLISASTLIVEIALTKFLSFKLFHHMTFAVLSFVILSFGVAGILTFTNPGKFKLNRGNPWAALGQYAALYAISVGIVIPILCWLPINPFDPNVNAVLRAVAGPVLFLLLSTPFFLAGICISQTLAISKHKVQVIYFWDLLAAAVGAAACPSLLILLGGYGTIVAAGILGIFAAVAYWWCGQEKRGVQQSIYLGAGAVSLLCCALYPHWAFQKYGIDIRTFKDAGPQIVLRDFHGVRNTHWNAVARVDVSNTGSSDDQCYRFGLSVDAYHRDIPGRYVLLDGGANTRQFKAVGDIAQQTYLGNALWASPYIAKPGCQRSLIIGGGGGIDILVGKYFKVPHLKVVELNPAIYDLLAGKIDDHGDEYTRWLRSDATTSVSLANDEARHFATTQKPDTYDVMQASGVDTLTAIQTGGMSLVENYLYTVNAVGDYMRMLKPDGILSLTHWRTNESGTSLRMFLTYLEYLDSQGVKDPWRHIVVVSGPDWTDSMLKKSPFTEAELERIRTWASAAHMSLVFDPERRNSAAGHLMDCEHWYDDVGFLSPADRRQKIERTPDLPQPVYDDKPYFYSFNHGGLWANAAGSTMPISLLATTLLFGLFFLIAPLVDFHDKISKPVVWSAFYFAVCGFAFLLYETAIIQLFSVFVGGPVYALSIVLVSVLSGYSLGSLIASRLNLSGSLFTIFGALLGAVFLILYLGVPQVIQLLLPLELPARLAVTSLITVLSSAAIGIVISSALAVIRARFGNVVSWMWGVSSIANAIGSMCFVAVTQTIGISSCLAIVGCLYLFANFAFARLVAGGEAQPASVKATDGLSQA